MPDAQATEPAAVASLVPGADGVWAVVGTWTLPGLHARGPAGDLPAADPVPTTLDGAGLVAIDRSGAWVLQRWLTAAGAAGVAAAAPRCGPGRRAQRH